jgi:hypothetical protein
MHPGADSRGYNFLHDYSQQLNHCIPMCLTHPLISLGFCPLYTVNWSQDPIHRFTSSEGYCLEKKKNTEPGGGIPAGVEAK